MSEPTPEILTDGGPAEPATTIVPEDAAGHRKPSSKRRTAVIVGGVVGAGLVTAAGVALGMTLSGGGAQPEDVLPAGAVAYADVDFDPAAGQKVNAVRFFRSFPEVGTRLGSGDDLRSALVDLFAQGSSVDAATQIDPWVGDRAGVALMLTDGDLEPVAAIQTTDADKARAELPTLLGTDTGFAVVGDYVVLARTDAQAKQFADQGEQTPLAADPGFAQAVGGLGDGVASFFFDGSQLSDVTSVAGRPLPADFSVTSYEAAGQLGGIVRFDPKAVELLARSTGSAVAQGAQSESLVGTLPDTTLFAAGSAGTTKALQEQYSALVDQLDAVTGMSTEKMLQQQYDLRMPGDLFTLLGTDRVLAVDGAMSPMGLPDVGYRSLTDPGAAADLASRLDPLVRQWTSGLGAVVRPTSDGLVVATTPQYAQTLASGAGSLATTSAFRDALPDAAGASAMGYLDIDALQRLLKTFDPSAEPGGWDALRAVGFTATVNGDTANLRARLTLN
jgi:hypothetical protein